MLEMANSWTVTISFELSGIAIFASFGQQMEDNLSLNSSVERLKKFRIYGLSIPINEIP